MVLVSVGQHQHHQIYQVQFLLDSTGSITNNSIIHKLQHSKNQVMARQTSLINIEEWHQVLPPTSNILMVQVPVMLLQVTINQARQRIIEVFHPVHECQAPTLLPTIK